MNNNFLRLVEKTDKVDIDVFLSGDKKNIDYVKLLNNQIYIIKK